LTNAGGEAAIIGYLVAFDEFRIMCK